VKDKLCNKQDKKEGESKIRKKGKFCETGQEATIQIWNEIEKAAVVFESLIFSLGQSCIGNHIFVWERSKCSIHPPMHVL